MQNTHRTASKIIDAIHALSCETLEDLAKLEKRAVAALKRGSISADGAASIHQEIEWKRQWINVGRAAMAAEVVAEQAKQAEIARRRESMRAYTEELKISSFQWRMHG